MSADVFSRWAASRVSIWPPWTVPRGFPRISTSRPTIASTPYPTMGSVSTWVDYSRRSAKNRGDDWLRSTKRLGCSHHGIRTQTASSDQSSFLTERCSWAANLRPSADGRDRCLRFSMQRRASSSGNEGGLGGLQTPDRGSKIVDLGKEMPPLCRRGRTIEVNDQIRNVPAQLLRHVRKLRIHVLVLIHQPVLQARRRLVAASRLHEGQELLMALPLMGIPGWQRIRKIHRQLGDLLHLLRRERAQPFLGQAEDSFGPLGETCRRVLPQEGFLARQSIL